MNKYNGEERRVLIMPEAPREQRDNLYLLDFLVGEKTNPSKGLQGLAYKVLTDDAGLDKILKDSREYIEKLDIESHIITNQSNETYLIVRLDNKYYIFNQYLTKLAFKNCENIIEDLGRRYEDKVNKIKRLIA